MTAPAAPVDGQHVYTAGGSRYASDMNPDVNLAHAPAPNRWPDRVCLPFAFDPEALQTDLAAFDTTDWTRHFVLQNYEGKWDVLPLRAKRGATHPVAMIYSDPVATDYVDTPWLDHAPYLRAVLARFDCTVQSARLMRLTPGSTIKEHSDPDLDAALGRARIHVPVTTNDDVVFLLNRTPVDMAPGSVWYLRLADQHYVHNGGTTDRVHFVIDVLANDWLAGQLDAGVKAAEGAAADWMPIPHFTPRRRSATGRCISSAGQ